MADEPVKIPVLCDPSKNEECKKNCCAYLRRGTCAISLDEKNEVDYPETECFDALFHLLVIAEREELDEAEKETLYKASGMLAIYHEIVFPESTKGRLRIVD